MNRPVKKPGVGGVATGTNRGIYGKVFQTGKRRFSSGFMTVSGGIYVAFSCLPNLFDAQRKKQWRKQAASTRKAAFESIMKKLALTIILVIGLSGCATLTKPGGPFYGTGQKNKLSGALTLLQQGKSADAAEVLTAICEEPGVPGVTDEALFRLSVLRLGSVMEANVVEQSKHDLERLEKEYPSSSWVPLASTLREFLASTNNKLLREKKLKDQNLSLSRENRDLKEENRGLKEHNNSLSKEQRLLKESNLSLLKENAELRQNVEKMKTIDLDLERRPKR